MIHKVNITVPVIEPIKVSPQGKKELLVGGIKVSPLSDKNKNYKDITSVEKEVNAGANVTKMVFGSTVRPIEKSSSPNFVYGTAVTKPTPQVGTSGPTINLRSMPFPQSKHGWDLLFRDSLKPRTQEEKEKFKEYLIDEVANRLPCKVCVQHSKDYINSHDIRNYYNLKETIDGKVIDIGLFKYIWEFKNDVNRRLNKKQISLIEAYKLYN